MVSWLVSNWILTFYQPQRVTSGQSISVTSRCTFQNLSSPNQSLHKQKIRYKSTKHTYTNIKHNFSCRCCMRTSRRASRHQRGTVAMSHPRIWQQSRACSLSQDLRIIPVLATASRPFTANSSVSVARVACLDYLSHHFIFFCSSCVLLRYKIYIHMSKYIYTHIVTYSIYTLSAWSQHESIIVVLIPFLSKGLTVTKGRNRAWIVTICYDTNLPLAHPASV